MQLTPFEPNNLIFIDTEFTDLDPYSGEILSVGIVKLSGEECYVEVATDAEMSDWVKKHVAPNLKDPKLTREQAAEQICEFIGEEPPFAIAFVDNYDVIYLTKLFGVGKLPFRWLTIDMASILFAAGINPVKYQLDSTGAKAFYRKLGIDTKKYKHHHALDDARLLREVWVAITNKTNAEA